MKNGRSQMRAPVVVKGIVEGSAVAPEAQELREVRAIGDAVAPALGAIGDAAAPALDAVGDAIGAVGDAARPREGLPMLRDRVCGGWNQL